MEEEKNERLSPYEYREGIELQEESAPIKASLTTEQISRLFRTGEYGRVEFALMESLYRYFYLTKRNMGLFIDEKLKERKFCNYDNMVKKLWREGCIRRLSYGDTKLYALTDEARVYLQAKIEKLERKDRQGIIGPGNTPESVLECAALAQWHMSVLRGGNIHASLFYENTKPPKKALPAPSYLEIKRGKYTYKVASFAIPKAASNMQTFLEKLTALRDALAKETIGSMHNSIVLTVLVATGAQEMEHCAKILDEIKATQELPLYFIGETNTVFTKGLDLLYTVTTNDKNEIILDAISVQ